MRKSDKKIDNQIIKALTEVCQLALEDIDGFEWLTHSVNFDIFPASLKVICVFDTNSKLANYIASSNNLRLTSLITDSLADIGIKIQDVKQQVTLDSEENCTLHHDGNWRKRLS
tara:strand:- start:226 stop:567 length:342 start_codon:yes stop_codon:yes gene_type:complete